MKVVEIRVLRWTCSMDEGSGLKSVMKNNRFVYNNL